MSKTEEVTLPSTYTSGTLTSPLRDAHYREVLSSYKVKTSTNITLILISPELIQYVNLLGFLEQNDRLAVVTHPLFRKPVLIPCEWGSIWVFWGLLQSLKYSSVSSLIWRSLPPLTPFLKIYPNPCVQTGCDSNSLGWSLAPLWRECLRDLGYNQAKNTNSC